MNDTIHINAFEKANTPADRLKIARNLKGHSRKELATLTQIPEKSIEKYEYGSMEPNISRLHILCGALDISPETILGIKLLVPKNGIIPQPIKQISKYVEDCLEHFGELDTLCSQGIKNSPTKAYAHIEALITSLCFLTSEQFIDLAIARNFDTANTCSNILNSLHTPQQKRELNKRLIDHTALKVDLYEIQLKPLIKFAEDNDIDAEEGFFFNEWKGHSEIVPKIRKFIYRNLRLGFKIPDFNNENVFPKT